MYHDLNGDLPKNYQLLKSELLSSGAVVSMNKSFGPITDRWSNTSAIKWAGKMESDKTLIERFGVDDNSVKTLGFNILQGRDFDLTTYPTDSTAVMLNETAFKLMGFKEPLGQIVKDGDMEFHVIAVVKDFIFNNPYKPVAPTIIQGASRGLGYINMKLGTQYTTADNLKKVEAVFKKYNPEFPFAYKFADEEYAKKFSANLRLSNFISLFAGLSIFISCLGLFGLATYMAENRIKEIGIRKVLGASIFNITALLSKDFLVLVLIANVLAFPIAYYFMNNWLQDFPYRITINGWVFVLTALVALAIALLTVSFQAIKAAVANPVKSLRTE
jgi:putative ABC transport system permease protein